MISTLKRLSLSFYAILFSFGSIGIEEKYVRYEGDITSERLRPFMDELGNNEIGSLLLKRINELCGQVSNSFSLIVFKPGRKTSFCSRLIDGGSKTELIIEVAGFDECDCPCLHDTEDNEVKAIFAESSPFWLVLAHELIHLKHKLEEMCKNFCKQPDQVSSERELSFIPYSSANTIRISDILIGNYRYLDKFVPELKELRLDMTGLWTSLEERRTVIGPDADGICEASIRLSAGFPTRFIYQDKLVQSLEKKDVVNQSISSFLQSIISFSIRKSVNFCISESGIISKLTPIDVLLLKGKISASDIVERSDTISVATERIFRGLKQKESIRKIVDGDNANTVEEVIDGLLSKAEANRNQTGLLDIDWNLL